MKQDKKKYLMIYKTRGYEQLTKMAGEECLSIAQLQRKLIKAGWEQLYPNQKSLNI
jgi:hypothetical protein